jgi:ParB family chromosome partitioning protein
MPQSNRNLNLVSVHDILYDEKFNCRGPVFPKDVEGLAKLIEINGLINPVTVRPINKPHARFQLIAGHRRFIATTQLLGWEKIDARVVDCDDREAHRINLMENLGRQDLTPGQELEALLAMYGDGLPTDEEIAKSVGKSKIWVKRRLAILKLDRSCRAAFNDGRLGAFDLEVLINGPLDEQKVLVNQLLEAKQIGASTASIAAGRGRRALAWAAGTISDEELLDV